jgi:serine/threonine-protein kinase SRK2
MWPQIQAELGDGHVNLVSCKAVVLTDTHLGIVMEYAAGGNLTNYVQDKWETCGERGGLFLSEDEARYFFRVSAPSSMHHEGTLTCHPIPIAIH